MRSSLFEQALRSSSRIIKFPAMSNLGNAAEGRGAIGRGDHVVSAAVEFAAEGYLISHSNLIFHDAVSPGM